MVEWQQPIELHSHNPGVTVLGDLGFSTSHPDFRMRADLCLVTQIVENAVTDQSRVTRCLGGG